MDGDRAAARPTRGNAVPRPYPAVLAILLVMFVLRVLGQALVAIFDVPFLPPMQAWYSGLLPYPWLLSSQILIIGLFAGVCFDFARGAGFFAVPRRGFGLALLGLGAAYLGTMLIRYSVRMTLYPGERWAGGSIPTFFHWVLAGFLLTVGVFHWTRARRSDQPGPRTGSALSAALLAIGGVAVAAIMAWVGYRLAHLPPPAAAP